MSWAGRLFSPVDGDGDQPWLVLPNSLAADHAMWDPQMAAPMARAMRAEAAFDRAVAKHDRSRER